MAAWLPVAVWMVLIYFGSTDLLAASHTSRFLGPLILWLAPGLDANTVHGLQVLIRKAGHVSEYAVLCALCWRALAIPEWRTEARGELRRRAMTAWGIAVAFAVTDEWHQSFVPSREGQARDVAVDALGAALAIAGILWWIRRRTRTDPSPLQKTS
ncbi:MAG: VanZ family protein [Verrucomicrobiota bacterium]